MTCSVKLAVWIQSHSLRTMNPTQNANQQVWKECCVRGQYLDEEGCFVGQVVATDDLLEKDGDEEGGEHGEVGEEKIPAVGAHAAGEDERDGGASSAHVLVGFAQDADGQGDPEEREEAAHGMAGGQQRLGVQQRRAGDEGCFGDFALRGVCADRWLASGNGWGGFPGVRLHVVSDLLFQLRKKSMHIWQADSE